MNNFDDWSQIISKYLHSEADPLTSLTKFELEDDAARIAFIHAVLDRFLPEIYGVGKGQIMDSRGRLSNEMDIIIYRRDFPRLDLPGSRDIYLYESVIATVEVVGKLIKKTFFEALDQCASLGDLTPDIDPKVMNALAARNQLTMNDNRQYVHPDPMRTARFHLIGRPVSFIYGFSGYKTSPNQLVDALQGWMDERMEHNSPAEMKNLPAVVATHGCFAWRNSAPLTVNENCLVGVGTDSAPIRLIVLQLLHVLSRRLKVTTDGYGLKPGLDAYLKRMPPPKMEFFIGKPRNPGIAGDADKNIASESRKEAAKAMKKPAAKVLPKSNRVSSPSQNKPVAEDYKVSTKTFQPETVKKDAKTPGTSSVKESPENPTTISASEIKTRPSQPQLSPKKDAVQTKKPLANRAFSLNPKPRAVDAPFPVPNADMIPELNPDPPAIDYGAENKASGIESSSMVPAVDSADNSFMKSVKTSMREKSADSDEEFMETIKMKIVSSEPIPHLQPESEPEPEPFTSTIPQ
jgi:hypothetical protein